MVLHTMSNQEGIFSIPAVALGDYTITISKDGFAAQRQTVTLASDTSPVLHVELQRRSTKRLRSSPDLRRDSLPLRILTLVVNGLAVHNLLHDRMHLKQ